MQKKKNWWRGRGAWKKSFCRKYFSCCRKQRINGYLLLTGLFPPHVIAVFLSFVPQTVVHWIIMLGSVALYFIVTLAYSAVCVTCNPPSNPYWILQSQMEDPMFYLICILSTVVALLPRYRVCHSLNSVGLKIFNCPEFWGVFVSTF